MELPLCLIKKKYENVPGGDKFVEELQASPCPSSAAQALINQLQGFLLPRPKREKTSPNRRSQLEDLHDI